MPRRGENIRKRKDGRWEGRYIKNYDIYGKAKYASVYGKSYLEVKQKLITASSSIDVDTDIHKNKSLLFREVLFLWLENNRIKLKPSTYSKYCRIIEKHLVPVVSNTPISNVNTQYLNKILCEKSSKGRLDSCGGLSPTYVRTMGFILKSAMAFAQENNYYNTLKGTVIMPVKAKSQLKVLSLTEQERLEYVCSKNLSNKELGIILSLYTGMRLGEVCGLRWEDIDYETNTMPNAADKTVTQPADSVKCNNCGAFVNKNMRFCTSCGTPMVQNNSNNDVVAEPVKVEDKSKCTSCGAELDEDSAFCAECGTKIY